MSHNPLVLTLWFLLELAAVGSAAYWGWTQHDGILRLLLAIGVPLVLAVLWGTFRVDDGPKKAPVAIPGFLRLLLELAVFGTGVVLLYAAHQTNAALIFGGLVVLLYVMSYDRVIWLLTER